MNCSQQNRVPLLSVQSSNSIKVALSKLLNITNVITENEQVTVYSAT